MAKRLFDIIFSLLGLILIFPLFLIIAILIKLDSLGPVFYRGERVGKDGKEFRIFKFRTMVLDAEKLGGTATSLNDPRLTKLGKFLRKHKLDELSQLINVLNGEMSLVGPRPEVPFYVNIMTEKEKKIILSIKPGMTDWASLWDFYEGEILKESFDPEKTYQEKIRPEKIRLQIKYIKERNFWIDIKIILKTISKVIYQK